MTGFMMGKWRALLLEPFSLILPRQSSTQCGEADKAAKIWSSSRSCILRRYERRSNGWVCRSTGSILLLGCLALHSVAAGPHVSDLGPGLWGRSRPQYQRVMPHMVRVWFDEKMVGRYNDNKRMDYS